MLVIKMTADYYFKQGRGDDIRLRKKVTYISKHLQNFLQTFKTIISHSNICHGM